MKTIQIPEALSHLDVSGDPVEIGGGSVLGSVLLLPSGIHPEVSLRYKQGGSYNPGVTLSCVMKLRACERTVSVGNQNQLYDGYADNADITELKVPVPELLYVADLPYTTYRTKPAIRSYLYRYDTEKCIQEALPTIEHYFFPHIYHDAHMCLITEAYSPREMLSYFWSSNFHNDWWNLFDIHRRKNFDDDGLVKASGADTYVKYQNEARSAYMNSNHQGFVQTYTDYYKVDAKPLGIFVNRNPHPEFSDRLSTANDDFSIFAGFAFHANDGHCWIYAKDKTLYRLRPEQVQVV